MNGDCHFRHVRSYSMVEGETNESHNKRRVGK